MPYPTIAELMAGIRPEHRYDRLRTVGICRPANPRDIRPQFRQDKRREVTISHPPVGCGWLNSRLAKRGPIRWRDLGIVTYRDGVPTRRRERWLIDERRRA